MPAARAARHGAERHPQGVPGPQDLHLPAGPLAAAGRRRDRVVAPRSSPKFNPISVCGYHMRQAGCDAVQEIAFALGQRPRLPPGRGRPGRAGRPDRAALLVQHLDDARLLRGGRQAPGGAAAVGAPGARSGSAPQDAALAAAAPVLGRGRHVADRAASRSTTSSGSPTRRSRSCCRGAQAVHTMSWDEALGLPRRGGGPARAADAADPRPRERRRPDRRPARRLVLRRVADRRARAAGGRAAGRDRGAAAG